MIKKYVLPIFIMCLLAVPESYGNRFSEKNSPFDSKEQVASFKLKKNAVAYVKKLKKSGTAAVIKKANIDGQVVYRVLLKNGKKEKRPVQTASSAQSGRDSIKERSSAKELFEKIIDQKQTKLSDSKAQDNEPFASEEAPATETVPDNPTISEGEAKTASALPEKREVASSEAAPAKAAVGEPNPSETSAAAPKTNGLRDPGREVEISKFDNKEDAQKFLKKISDRGYVTILRSEVAKDGRTVYRIFVVVHDDQALTALSNPEPAPERSPASNVFEGTGRNIHGAVSLSGFFTDNAFNTHENRQNGYVILLSPEIWLLLPHYYQTPLPIEDSANRSPGGLQLSRLKPDVFRRYYTYLSYKADIPLLWSNFPARNTITHDVRGRFIYNFGRGLYLDLIDQFSRSYETRATNISIQPTQVDKFNSNLFNTIVYYDAGNRLRLRLDYANFLVSFDDLRNDYRDRTDNSVSGYLFYRLRPKTSAFIQYTFTDISYENNTSLDSQEQMLAGGLQWDFTAKSTGIIKAGYEVKDFDNFAETFKGFTFEVQGRHQFDPKNYLTLTAFRRTNETDINAAVFIVTYGVRADYRHVFSHRLSGIANFQYTKDKYHNLIPGFNAVEVDDETYQAGAMLQYNLRRWLKADLGYTYMKRNSNIPEFGFTSNTLLLRITGFL